MNSPVENSHTEVVPQSVPPQVQDLPIAPEPDVLVSNGSAYSCESSVSDLSVKEDLDVIVADDPDVYLERNDVPGVCMKYPDKTTSWTPIKISS